MPPAHPPSDVLPLDCSWCLPLDGEGTMYVSLRRTSPPRLLLGFLARRSSLSEPRRHAKPQPHVVATQGPARPIRGRVAQLVLSSQHGRRAVAAPFHHRPMSSSRLASRLLLLYRIPRILPLERRLRVTPYLSRQNGQESWGGNLLAGRCCRLLCSVRASIGTIPSGPQICCPKMDEEVKLAQVNNT